jgi:hypothetical protein
MVNGSMLGKPFWGVLIRVEVFEANVVYDPVLKSDASTILRTQEEMKPNSGRLKRVK